MIDYQVLKAAVLSLPREQKQDLMQALMQQDEIVDRAEWNAVTERIINRHRAAFEELAK